MNESTRANLSIQHEDVSLHTIGNVGFGAVEHIAIPLYIHKLMQQVILFADTFLTTVLDIPRTSVPAPGSVMPMAPTHSPEITLLKYRERWSSVELYVRGFIKEDEK